LEVGAYLKMSETDLTDPGIQSDLQLFIQAARETAELFQKRDLVRKQWDLSMDYWPWFPQYEIQLRPHLVSVDLVKYQDSGGTFITMDPGSFIVNASRHPGIIAPLYNQEWPTFTPWPSSSILIRFTAGVSPDSIFWSDAGARVKVGMKYLISAWFTNRIPFEMGISAANEYPMTVTSCLSYGALPSVR